MKIKILTISLLLSMLFLISCSKGNLSDTTNLSDTLRINFLGYDKVGYLEYNEEEIKVKAKEAVFKSLGFNETETEILVQDADASHALENNTPEIEEKIKKALDILDSIEYGFDKTSNLTNGDTIVFEVKSNLKNSPIKDEKKSFEVSGLEKADIVTFDDIIKDEHYTIKGYNGYGVITIDPDILILDTKHTDHLSNGEKISLKINPVYIAKLAEEGKIIKETDKKIEVQGLPEITDIENLSTLAAKLPDYVKSRNKDGANILYKETYAIENKGYFISYGKEALFTDKPSINLKGIFKITKSSTNIASSEKGTTEVKEYYQIYGYNNVEVFENNLILSDLNQKSDYDSSEYSDFESTVAQLKSEGYIEYKLNQ